MPHGVGHINVSSMLQQAVTDFGVVCCSTLSLHITTTVCVYKLYLLIYVQQTVYLWMRSVIYYYLRQVPGMSHSTCG